jgi:anti-sigma regulatory factor (Ser/Thr protein kinase)
MREIALHVLDIVQNSLAAQAKNIRITVIEDPPEDKMSVKIEDDGWGMEHKTVKQVLDPFYTTRTTRKVGLGLALLQANTQACEGSLEIKSAPGKGTNVKAVFKLSHIDRPPLGDMGSTLVTLISGSPDVNFFYLHRYGEKGFSISTLEIKKHLEEVALNHPEVLAWLLNFFREKEKELNLPSQ